MFTLSSEKMLGCRNGSTNDSMSTIKSFTKSSTSTTTATATIWSSSWQTQVSLDCDSKCSTFLRFVFVVSSSVLWSYSHVVSIFSTSMIVQHWQQINGHYFPMWSIVTMVKTSVGHVRSMLEEKSSLPVKLRSKALDTLNLISEPSPFTSSFTSNDTSLSSLIQQCTKSTSSE